MTYLQALKALDARQETRIVLGLKRLEKSLSRLGNPHAELLAVHVVGTNGKGSVCAMLSSVFTQAGMKTGLYTSPHLWDVRERIQINNIKISRSDFTRLFKAVVAADRERKLTYFEILTFMAFLYFKERRVKIAVLETGLGGRLDATNVIPAPLASVITSIDMDHMAFLGETLPKIAAEKAGIIKKHTPVFCAPLKAAAMKVIRAKARKLGAPLILVREPHRLVRTDWARGRMILRDSAGQRYPLGLLGGRQPFNAALAEAALKPLGIPSAVFRRGMAKASCPCRFQVIRRGKKTAILDGAHNPEAAEALAKSWKASPWAKGRSRWIMGVMKDKDAGAIMKALAPALKEVVLVRPPSPRAMEPLELAAFVRRAAPKAHVTIERDPKTAIESWRKEGRAKTAVLCGSFYLAGLAAEILGADA